MKMKHDLPWVFDPTWAFCTQYDDIILDMQVLLYISKYSRFFFKNEIFLWKRMHSCIISLMSPTENSVLSHPGVITPYFGQHCTGWHKANPYHRNRDKISYPVVCHLPWCAKMQTKSLCGGLMSFIMSTKMKV